MSMKRIATGLAVICQSIGFVIAQDAATPVPYIDGKVKYSEVIQVEGSSPAQLYGKAKLWFATAFRSAQDVIQLDDRENGNILGKGVILKDEQRGLTQIRKTWYFTVKVQVKDGRYRAEIYDITYTFEMPGNNIGAGVSKINLDEYFQNPKIYEKNGSLKDAAATFASETNDYMNGLLTDLKKSMTEQLDSDF